MSRAGREAQKWKQEQLQQFVEPHFFPETEIAATRGYLAGYKKRGELDAEVARDAPRLKVIEAIRELDK